jgi:hypothetical protein
MRGKAEMFPKTRPIVLGIMGLLLFLSSCVPFGASGLPTPDPDTIMLLAAQTAAAAQTQTAVVFRPTDTPSPTATTPFTQTPSITPSPTATFIFAYTPTSAALLDGSGGNVVIAPVKPTHTPDKQFACALMSWEPRLDYVFKPEQRFTAYITVRNAGYHFWDYKSIDVVYDGGSWFATRRLYDLPRTVYPGDTISIGIPMQAPKSPGKYHSYWRLKVGRRTYFCRMKVEFTVEK